jgi:Bacterial Ig-like domain (group 3)/Concanavalin A-like lectin/glucanases superfamily
MTAQAFRNRSSRLRSVLKSSPAFSTAVSAEPHEVGLTKVSYWAKNRGAHSLFRASVIKLLCVLLAVCAATSVAAGQSLIAFGIPQQGYHAVNGTYSATLQLLGTADPSSLRVLLNNTDVTTTFNVSNCVQAPCTLQATLTTANGIVVGANMLTAKVLGTTGAADSARQRFSYGSGQVTDPTTGSAPGYIVPVQQTGTTITIQTPTPITIGPCTTGGNVLRIVDLNRSTLIVKSDNCVADTAVAGALGAFNESDLIFVVSAPGATTGAADFTAIGGSKPKAGLSGYAAVSYGDASKGIAFEAYQDAKRSNTNVYSTIRGNLINMGCTGRYTIGNNKKVAPPTTLSACTANNSSTLYMFQAADTEAFAMVPGAPGTAGSPGLPTIYLGNSSNVPTGDDNTPTNQMLPANTNSGGGLFTNQTLTPTFSDNTPNHTAAGGMYLVTLDRVDLSLIGTPTLYITNCGCTDHATYDNPQIQALATALDATAPDKLYLLTSAGFPFNADADAAPLLAALTALDVSSYALQGIIPDALGTPAGAGFSLAVASNPGTSAGLVKNYSTVTNSQQGESGALRGVLAKQGSQYYMPVNVAPFDVSNMPVYSTANDYLAFAAGFAIGSSEPVAWPHMRTLAERAAYADISNQLITTNLYPGSTCDSNCYDVRFYYTGDEAASIYYVEGPSAVQFNSTLATNHNYTSTDFMNVQQQLELEQVYLEEVINYQAFERQINTSASENIGLALTQSGTNIALVLQSDLGQPNAGVSALNVTADVSNDIAAFISGLGALQAKQSIADSTLFKIGVPALSGITWEIAALIATYNDVAKSTPNPDPYVVQLQDLIASETNTATNAAITLNGDLETGTATYFNGIYSDWFRLQSVALMSVNQNFGGWYVTDTGQGDVLQSYTNSMVQQQQMKMWQQILPQYFQKAQYNGAAIGYFIDYNSQDMLGAQAAFTNEYPYDSSALDPPGPVAFPGSYDYTWAGRTSAGSPVCQDITYVFKKDQWNSFMPSSMASILMSAPTSSSSSAAQQNLNIDQNWLFDEWGLPWFTKLENGEGLGFPETVRSYAPVEHEDWKCSDHGTPFGNAMPAFQITSGSQTITQGAASITVAGTITAGTKIPPGSVLITIDDFSATATIKSSDGSFSTSFPTNNIPASSTPYVITYSFAATGKFAATTDTSTTLTINSGNTDVDLSVTAGTIHYGQSITLSATVKSPAGTPTAGTVAFLDGATTINTATLTSSNNGQVSYTASLTGGSHQLSANYSGSGQWSGATSLPIVELIAPVQTTFTSTSGNGDIIFGTPTFPVSGRISAQLGSQTLYPPDGDVVTVTIGGVQFSTRINSAAATTPTPGYFAMSFPSTSFFPGTYQIQVYFAGDGNFAPVSDTSTSLLVQRVTPVFSGLTPSQTIQAGTPSVALSGNIVPINGITPTGTVTVSINGVNSAPAPLTNGSFTLGYNTALLPSGSAYPVIYTYSGDTNYATNFDQSTKLTVSDTAISVAFRNLTPSQAIGFGQSSVKLSGTISTPPQSGGVLTQSSGTGTLFNFYADPQNPAAQANTSHATFSAWINTTGKSKQLISYTDDSFTNMNNSGDNGYMYMYIQGDQVGVHWEGDVPYTSDNWLSTDQTSISDGQWHYIAIVFGSDGTNGLWNARLYKDGVSTGEVFAQHLVTFDETMNLGSSLLDTSFPPFAGALWNAKIWNQALSATDLAADMYKFYPSSLPTGLLLETSFDVATQEASNVAGFDSQDVAGLVVNEGLPTQAPLPGEQISVNIGANTQQTTLGVLGSFTIDFPTSAITPGDYPIQYRYSGDSTFGATYDASTSLVVQQSVTTTNLTSLPSSTTSITYGTPVTFTATVAGTNAAPTGTVTFYDGTTAIGPVELLTAGSASFSTSSLAVATHNIMAVYPGATNYAPSISTIIPVTIKPLPPVFTDLTSLTITTGTPSVTVGGVISTAVGIPSGSVTIAASGPGTVQTSAPIRVDGSFSAVLDTSHLAVGTYQITYSYTASGNFGNATDGSTQLIVKLASTSTTLISSASSVAYETGVLFTATVSSPNITPSGTVTFMDGATALTPSMTLAFGVASLPTSTLTPGPHSITAVYGGDATNATSTSNAVTVTVVPLTTSFYSGASPAPVPYGSAPVYLSGQIAGISGGTVVDYPPVGQPITITIGNISQTVLLQSYSTFRSYFPIMNLAAGTYPIKLDYAGNAQFSSMSDTSLQLTVAKATPGFSSLIANPTIHSWAPSIALSGVVSAQPQTGAVLQFTQSNDTGVGGVVLPYDPTAVSTDSATYSVWIKTSAKTQQMVFQVSYEHPYIYMQNDQLGVLWDGAGNGWLSADTTPISDGLWHNIAITFNQGKITFYKDGIATSDNLSVANSYHSDGSLNLGGSYDHIPSFLGEMWNAKLWSKALSAADIQQDVFAIYGSPLPAGLQLLSTFDVNSKTVTNIVNGTTVVTPTDPATDPQIVTDALPVPAPSVAEPVLATINGQDTPLWVGANGSFTGTVDTSTLANGTYPITYTFGGDSNFVAATDKTTALTVQFGATVTTLTSSLNPAPFATNVMLTATVAPKEGVGVPSGSVVFMDGSTAIGSPMPLNAGVATLPTSSLSAGTHSITAVYGGDTTYGGSTSNGLTQSIGGLKPVFVTLTPSQSIALGTPSVTLGGQIAAGTYIPTGTVSITLGGSTTPATIQSDGTFSASVETYALGIDSYAVTYSFAASGNFKGASDSNTRVTVAAGYTSTELTSSAATAAYGTFITFTATISNPSTATGSVTFYDNGNQVSAPAAVTAGTAMWQTGSLSVGSHSITAVYTSDSPLYVGSTSPALAEKVTALSSAFSNLTPSQTAGAGATNASLAGTISSTPSSGSVLQYLTATTTFGSGVLLQNDATGVSTHGATYSMWIKTTAKTEQILFQVSNFHPIISMTGDQLNVWWGYSDGLKMWQSADTKPISDGNWHQIAVVFNQGAIKFYKDGVATSDSFTVPAEGNADPATNIGGSVSNVAGFLGQIWNAKVWAGAMSDADVAADMLQSYTSGLPVNLRLLTSFDSNANTVTNTVNGQAVTIDSASLASIASASLPVYYPAVGEPISINIGSQSQTVNVAAYGSFTSNFPLGPLAANTYPIQYAYQGNAYLASNSDDSTNLTVTNVSTNTVVKSSGLTANYGTTVNFTATVGLANGGNAVPTGSVIFNDGGVPLGNGQPVTLANGTAPFPISTLASGLHSITAVYTSDNPSLFSNSTSQPILQTISKLTPAFSGLTKSQSVNQGATVSLGGTIAAGSTIPAGGTVSITLNGNSKNATVASDGSFSQSFTISSMTPQDYPVTYAYQSSDNFSGISDSTTTILTVAGAVAPTVKMWSVPSTVAQGAGLTLYATVQGTGSVIPSGTVQFSEYTYDVNSQPVAHYYGVGTVDSTGTVTVITPMTGYENPTAIAGTHILAATYGGDNQIYTGATSPNYTLTVTSQVGSAEPGLALTLGNGASTSVTVAQGVSANFPMSLAPVGGFTGNVALTCTPADAVTTISCSASPALVTLGSGTQNATVTITTVDSTASAVRKAAFVIGALALIPLAFRRRRAIGSMLLLVAMVTFASTGCGGSSSGSSSGQKLQYASPGTYNFTVTASSTSGTSATSSVKVSVIVQ